MDLPYEQLSRSDVRRQILSHIQNAESQHLQKVIDVTINEECAKVAEAAGKKQRAQAYREAAADIRRECEALLRGIEVLRREYGDVLDAPVDSAGEDASHEGPPVRIK